MCELFAMSALQPAEVSFSLEESSRHGGLSGPHQDGWGIAFYHYRDARIIREPLPAASSAYVRFIACWLKSILLQMLRLVLGCEITDFVKNAKKVSGYPSDHNWQPYSLGFDSTANRSNSD